MNLKEAKLKNLDVVSLMPNQITPYKVAMNAIGRTVEEFTEEVHGFTLHFLAIGPRPGSGNIAKEMNKRAKTVRQFICEEGQ